MLSAWNMYIVQLLSITEVFNSIGFFLQYFVVILQLVARTDLAIFRRGLKD